MKAFFCLSSLLDTYLTAMLGLTLENDLTPDKRYIFSQLLHQKSG
jgi:hypothetical protein